jgi:ribonucleoside-triphosphate reductase
MSDPRADAVRLKNMRIGVALGGICDFLPTPSMLRQMALAVRQEADEYAAELGVSRPIAVTTVKPSGTISLLNGSSPGIHRPFAPYYVRRVRVADNDPMAAALAEAGVPSERCQYDKSGRDLVFEFPSRARGDAAVNVQNEPVASQIERQVAVQENWADNSVSSTISFAAEEKDELAALLRRNCKRLKSISCLPKKHAYKQPPYEEISREEYEARMGRIRVDHPLTAEGEGIQMDECEGGACPVR